VTALDPGCGISCTAQVAGVPAYDLDNVVVDDRGALDNAGWLSLEAKCTLPPLRLDLSH
jgi:hypothetical protein